MPLQGFFFYTRVCYRTGVRRRVYGVNWGQEGTVVGAAIALGDGGSREGTGERFRAVREP